VNAAAPNDVRVTHNLASEIHKAIAFAGIDTAILAQRIKESESFIRSILEGEDDLERLINIRLLRKITEATGYEIRLRILLPNNVKRRRAVKSRKESQS